MSDAKQEDRKVNAVKPADVKKGDLMVFSYWGKVTKVISGPKGNSVQVAFIDNPKDEFAVNGDELLSKAASADQFTEEVKVSMTKAAEILVSSYNRPFTVVFKKKTGDIRTLRGRLLAPEPLLGSSHVEDLDIVGDVTKRMRQVIHREIISLTVDGVKYVVKK